MLLDVVDVGAVAPKTFDELAGLPKAFVFVLPPNIL